MGRPLKAAAAGGSKVRSYRDQLRGRRDWKHLLLRESGLPGPRGNLELARAFAHEASRKQIEASLHIALKSSPENTPESFVVFCGVLSLGRLIAAGDHALLGRLRGYASDPRWRIREAVAMALQMLGEADIRFLRREMGKWTRGNWYEKRAAAAALAEPRLLTDEANTRGALELLDSITASLVGAADRRSEPFKALRKGMAYCWSVVVAANPAAGKPIFEKWLGTEDSDIRWMLKQNLKKQRLSRAHRAWAKGCLALLEHPTPQAVQGADSGETPFRIE
jgi:hypothetical protein